jgi:hypothetical protein
MPAMPPHLTYQMAPPPPPAADPRLSTPGPRAALFGQQLEHSSSPGFPQIWNMLQTLKQQVDAISQRLDFVHQDTQVVQADAQRALSTATNQRGAMDSVENKVTDMAQSLRTLSNSFDVQVTKAKADSQRMTSFQAEVKGKLATVARSVQTVRWTAESARVDAHRGLDATRALAESCKKGDISQFTIAEPRYEEITEDEGLTGIAQGDVQALEEEGPTEIQDGSDEEETTEEEQPNGIAKRAAAAQKPKGKTPKRQKK